MDSFAKIKRITELLISKTNREMLSDKLSKSEWADLYARCVGFKTIMNAINDIEANSICVSEEMIEELWK